MISTFSSIYLGLKAMPVRFEGYSDLDPLPRDVIPPTVPLYKPHDKKARFKVLVFLTYWHLFNDYAKKAVDPDAQASEAYRLIRKRLPYECRQTCRVEAGLPLTCFIIATNETEEQLERSQDLELINLVRDAITFDSGAPIWMRPYSRKH